MEDQLSTSSFKIGDIPLIPPLITNNIITELQYYRQLAITVEERIKILEIARDAVFNKSRNEAEKDEIKSMDKPIKDKSEKEVELNNVEAIVLSEDHDNTTDLAFKSTSDSIPDMTSVNILTDYPTKDTNECLIDIDIPITEKDKNEILEDKNISVCESNPTQLENIDKFILDEDKSCLNETLLGDSVSSDTITASTDINQYLNTSASTKTDETTETTPENWKPQVPKTLDIVPITVDQSEPSNKLILTDEETPKLVRRGSYVLDTPSPMLLAHMQNEITNAEYVPTPTQSTKRKEWNITQTKTDWENQTNLKEINSSQMNSANKLKKGNHSNIPSQRVCKSVSNSKTGSPLDMYKPTKSFDCIQTMFIKECYSPKTSYNKTTNQNQKYVSTINGANGIKNSGSKKSNNKNTSILNLANRLSGSLGSLSSVSLKSVKRTEKKNNNDSNSNKNHNHDTIRNNDACSFSKKQKPLITSEKIITIFKEIQDTHKKQMVELITRQQKEQMSMQENFKKQQILLLAQIRKAFPEISISALSEAITGKSAEHTTPCSKTVNDKSDSLQKDTNKPQINGINYEDENQQTNIKSPMDYSHPAKELSSTSCHLTIQPTTPTVAPYYLSNCQATQTLNQSSSMLSSHVQLPNVRIIDDIPVGNPVRRHSSVSRQLFPLDSKTIHVPVLDNSLYAEKHIKAATIINAYARGFLVRRLMKTEKVIALKNTYKEALHCMLRLHVDAPLNLPELNFHQRLQLQCDAASMNIVDLFSQNPTKRMEIIAHDREIRKARSDRPSSARSYSFATQRTLARKKLKEMGICPSLQSSVMSKSCPARTRCQTWTSNSKERKATTSLINQGIKRSTSAGAVRKPWR